jgi:hypothetical protein
MSGLIVYAGVAITGDGAVLVSLASMLVVGWRSCGDRLSCTGVNLIFQLK